MKFIIISGLSGAGKSHALATFEDLGFYCVDNMPISLIPKFAELAKATKGQYENVALVTDVRAGQGAEELLDNLDNILDGTLEYRVVFLEASTEVLINRYKETRRKHPLAAEGLQIPEAIFEERERLEAIRNRADYVIDTTALSVSKLREYLVSLFLEDKRRPIVLTVLSFGFKYGIPTESDMVFDVRFLPNPYYDPGLRQKNGKSPEVKQYVMNGGAAEELLKMLRDLFDFLIPRYISEGKNSLVVSVGCTGGKHRSVAIAEELCAYFKKAGYFTTINHRDIDRHKA